MLFQKMAPGASDGDDDIDLQDFGQTILKRWRTVLGITAAATLLALYAVMFAPPQFSATGIFYLGEGQTVVDSTSQTNFLSDYQVVNSVNTQLQLIQSPALLEQAILETGLNASIVPLNQKPLPYWKWRFLYGKSIDVFAPGPNGLTAQFAMISDPSSQGADFILAFDANGQYRLMYPGGFFSKPVPFATGTLGQPTLAQGISLVIKSASGASPPPAGSTYDLSIIPVKTMAQNIAGRISIAAAGPAVSPTNVAQVQFAWENPFEATRFVSNLMADFIYSQLSWKTESASNTETYISAQLQKISSALSQANEAQASYQSKTGIVDVPSNAQGVVTQLNAYQSQRSTLLLQKEALEHLVAAVSQKGSGVNPYLISQANDPVLAQLSTTLAEAEAKLESQRTQFTVASPEVSQLQATVDNIESAITSVLQNDDALAAKSLANLDAMIAQYQDTLKAMPAESLQVGQLSRSSDVLGTLYGLLMQKEEEAEVSKAATIENTRIIAPAEIPLYASSPRPTITIIAGFLLGLIAGLAVVLAQRAISDRFRSDFEIRRAVGVPVYGIIPQRRGADMKYGVFTRERASPFTEAFRLLRRGLYDLPATKPSRIILVTSAASNDGKTTVATNIAKVLADDGHRVLLVDADLHRGHIYKPLKIQNGPGLSEWLLEHTRPNLLAVEKQRFKVLAAGDFPPNPAELLSSSQPDGVFKTLREEFDFIILDSPPFPLVSDALTLCKQADLVLSVVYVDRTPRRNFATHCEILANAGCRHGMVINGVEFGPFAYGDSYGYGGTPQRPVGLGGRMARAYRGGMRRTANFLLGRGR